MSNFYNPESITTNSVEKLIHFDKKYEEEVQNVINPVSLAISLSQIHDVKFLDKDGEDVSITHEIIASSEFLIGLSTSWLRINPRNDAHLMLDETIGDLRIIFSVVDVVLKKDYSSSMVSIAEILTGKTLEQLASLIILFDKYTFYNANSYVINYFQMKFGRDAFMVNAS